MPTSDIITYSTVWEAKPISTTSSAENDVTSTTSSSRSVLDDVWEAKPKYSPQAAHKPSRQANMQASSPAPRRAGKGHWEQPKEEVRGERNPRRLREVVFVVVVVFVTSSL